MPKLKKNLTVCFLTEEAEDYGVNQAIVIAHLRQWILSNIKKNKNFIRGKHWTYNSYQQYAKILSFLTPRQIRYVLRDLEKRGVLLTRPFVYNYRKVKGYTFKHDSMLKIVVKTVHKKEPIVRHIAEGF